MVAKNCDGAVPQHGDFTDDDHALLGAAREIIEKQRDALDRQSFHEALETVWVVIRSANGYVDAQAPWKLKKEDPDRMATVLYVLSESIRRIALVLQPFMPDTMSRMLEQVAVSTDHRTFAHLGEDYHLRPGTALPEPEGLFPRFIVE
jgi:methionyl-tRNA synthetase